MRKKVFMIITVLITVFSSGLFYGQVMVVTDAGANAKMVKQLATASEQLVQTKKTVENSTEVLEITKQVKEGLEKVSKVLSDGQMALSALKNFESCYDIIAKADKKVRALKDNDLLIEKGMQKHVERTGIVIDQLTTYARFLQDLMRDNKLKMDDGKRSNLLLRMYEKSIELQEKCGELYRNTSNLIDRSKF